MQLKRGVLVMAVSAALSACGGGGGGGGGGGSFGNPFIRSEVPYHTPTRVDTYQPLVGTGFNNAIQDIYTKDLNNDTVQEVIIGGRQTQPATQATWRDTALQVFGWNTGSFAKETSTWFSGTDNQIRGTEPAIRFGDFNGDGKIDMFVAPSTDMTHYGPGIVYFNNGTTAFTKTTLNLGDVWAHDAVVKDINNDGYADIITSDYGRKMTISYGSSARTFTTYTGAIGTSGASSISVADYLNNGTQTIVLTDANSNVTSDTKLYSFSTASGEIALTEVATLPASRFHQAKWSTQLAASPTAPHAVRNLSMDFNGDGKMDIVVLDSLNGANGVVYSEVQFLKNNGSGSFTDVTDTVLTKYTTTSMTSYQPVLVDVNNDGLMDILLSSSTSATSAMAPVATRVLIRTQEGNFVESYTDVFKDFQTQIRNATTNPNNTLQTVNVVMGPSSELYLVSTVEYQDSGTYKSAVYLSKIGSTGTVNAQSTIAALQQAWPYMSSVQANEVLARTSMLNLNSTPILDWESLWRPVGSLGITLDGRAGARIPLNGFLSVPGMKNDLLNNISTVDELGRHFQVNLTAMNYKPTVMPARYSLMPTDSTQNWSSRFVNGYHYDMPGMSLRSDNAHEYSASLTNRQFGGDGPWTYRIGMARMMGSPWVAFSGVFGSVQNTDMIDVTANRVWLSKDKESALFAQGGIIQATTNFHNGLVTKIDPLYAGYATAGYQDKKWSLYAGIQPTVFAGGLDLKLPTSVDTNGTMHYTNNRVNVRNDIVTYAGFERRWMPFRDQTVKFSGVVNDQGAYQTGVSYRIDF
jgi:hypothetical protein